MRYDNKLKKNIKVRLQMSRASDETFYLTMEDYASGTVIASVSLDDKGIADLISTRYTEPSDAEYYANPNIGKKMEVKTFKVDISKLMPHIFTSFYDKDRAQDLKRVYDLAEDINSGWVADRDGYNNKCRSSNFYIVTLRKYLD